MADDRFSGAVAAPASGALATNKVLRNTYILLAATLAFSAVMALVSYQLRVPFLGLMPTLAGFFGLMFLVHKTANSAFGLVSVFLFTGFLGFTLGPILTAYLSLPNGGTLVAQAMGLTAFTFVGLSGYVLTTKADMSFMRGAIVAGMMVFLGIIGMSVIAHLAGWAIPSGVHLAISGFVVLLMSAYILWETSEIVHGGETNYILATTSLFVSIYNLFTSLLHLLGAMGDD